MPQRMSAFRPFVTNAALFINDQIGLSAVAQKNSVNDRCAGQSSLS